jgi:enediyne biosynthesis thioesterase
MGKVYEYRATVTIGDTNLLQNMYFLNFFKLQGICRELWVRDCVQDAMSTFAGGLVLVTKSASCEFMRDFNLFDRIVVQMQFVKMAHTYSDVRFRFLEEQSMELRAEGMQRLLCAGPDHRPCAIPDNFKKAALEYFDDDSAKTNVRERGKDRQADAAEESG